MKRVVVYDFDKTLTHKDTLAGFFRHCAKRDIWYPFKWFLYYIAMVAAKLSLIDNSRLKRFGVSLFLQGKSREKIAACAESYGDKISFNALFDELLERCEMRGTQESIYIVSASFEEYLRPIFPAKVEVLGSQLEYRDNEVSGLKMNCYKAQKAKRFREKGIGKIDLLYTDSYSDASLAQMSQTTVVIHAERRITYDNYAAFERHFR